MIESNVNELRTGGEWLRVNGRRKYPQSPDSRRRWFQVSKLRRYGLTQERFDLLLEQQGHACGMCRKPFGSEQRVCVDHDHTCCPDERQSCGECIRGLLCISCNTTLGHIERNYAVARAYLDRPPVGWVDLKPAASE